MKYGGGGMIKHYWAILCRYSAYRAWLVERQNEERKQRGQ